MGARIQPTAAYTVWYLRKADLSHSPNNPLKIGCKRVFSHHKALYLHNELAIIAGIYSVKYTESCQTPKQSVELESSTYSVVLVLAYPLSPIGLNHPWNSADCVSRIFKSLFIMATNH